jgi:hypothetical protein
LILRLDPLSRSDPLILPVSKPAPRGKTSLNFASDLDFEEPNGY